jgi:polar amino acid transport system substrate-binding protein
LAVTFVLLWMLPDIVTWLTRKPDEAWARVQSSGAIRFATDASYPPFEGVGGDGVFYGLDIDVAREIARRLGAEAQFQNVGIDGLYDVLRAGRAEASISAMPIDAARLDRWAFSRPYFDAGLVLIARESSNLKRAQDLPGHTVAVVLGSDGDARLRHDQRQSTGIVAARFDSALDAIQAVDAGRADAAIVDSVIARQMKLHIATQLTHDPYAVAVWGGSAELLAAIDRALRDMQADGTLDRLISQWIE